MGIGLIAVVIFAIYAAGTTAVLTVQDKYLTFDDISVVRGTALSNAARLISDLGGDPAALLGAAGIRLEDAGEYDVFIPLAGVLQVVETAARATGAPDFGRQLAERQGIQILGPVGVAARTAPTVGHAVGIFTTFMTAYSPALAVSLLHVDTDTAFVDLEVLLDKMPPSPQSVELTLGVTLRVLRLLLGPEYAPRSVHLPHLPLTPEPDYVRYYGCTPHFAEPKAGFTVRADDLRRPLRRDDVAHQAMVEYLTRVTERDTGLTQSIGAIVRQLLPTGAVTLEVIAAQFAVHPKALQRKLADEGTTFAAVVDNTRMRMAERYLRDTRISLSHLSRELGYAEQSVLTRSCRRWFGSGPAAYRKTHRARKNPMG